ncbi:hypothetical protein [Sphingomonas crusticola]|uniref:hypothetical protein n=1 Tax=Sphingomonas crusticola TaxID=1697973 RepID=UPI000E265EA5|nr:hypothetical protein [Sphingomonas crusticola]
MLRQFISAAIALTIAAPLAAQSVDQDVRCAVASNFFMKQEKDPGGQQLAKSASFYYLGRLDMRLSVPQLNAALMAQGRAMKAADLAPTMTACANRLTAKIKSLQNSAAPAPAPASKPKAPAPKAK